jgi:hypothetical protein
MAKKKLTRIERLIRDRPEMFDFGDIPADRVKIPEQEARYEKWAKAHRKMVVEAMGANSKAAR